MANSVANAALEGLAAREFAAKEALEEVEVGAYQETGYVASPDEEPPSRVAPEEEAAEEGPAAPEAVAESPSPPEQTKAAE
jgi:hypothetical protein